MKINHPITLSNSLNTVAIFSPKTPKEVEGSSRGVNDWFANAKCKLHLHCLELITIDPRIEFKVMVGDKTGDSVIESYNDLHRRYEFKGDKNDKIDVTQNSLLLGDVKLVFNFTKHYITCCEHEGVPKSFAPITNSRLGDALKGKLIVIYFQSLNSIRQMERIGLSPNYIRELRDKFTGRTDAKGSNMYNMYDFISTQLSNLPPDHFMLKDEIRVVRCIEVDESQIGLLSQPKNAGKTIRFSTCSLEVSLCNPIDASQHAQLSPENTMSNEAINSFRDHGLSCYIVDNGNKISSRYHYFLGKAREIPKVVDTNVMEGLYAVSVNAKEIFDHRRVVHLDDIDTVPYVFKTIEEAEHGADKRKLFEQETTELHAQAQRELLLAKTKAEQEKLDMQNRRNEAEFEFSKILRHMEEQSRKDKEEHERRLSELRLENERILSQYKQEIERLKSDTMRSKTVYERDKYGYDSYTMRMKSEYEQERYSRESSLETIKTVGAVAALTLGAVMVYKKL